MTGIKRKTAAIAFPMAGFVLLASLVMVPHSALAADEFFMSKLRAIQDGNVIRVDDNLEGTIGLPVECVGGIESSADADAMKCYLISDEDSWASDYKTDPTVVVQEGSAGACPEGAGFETSKDCFLTTFEGSAFAGSGEYRFVAEFYKGDTLVDIAKDDYRLQSFFVLPESGIRAIALIGSSLGAFTVYRVMQKRTS